jgi:predicted dehydrogenase
LDRQWFGLWPLEQACRVRKPVFCAVAPLLDDPHAEDFRRRIQAADLPVMTALGPALAPAVLRLHDLVVNRLGSVRVAHCDWTEPRRSSSPARPIPGVRALPALLFTCAYLLEGEPVSVKMDAPDGAEFASVLAEFGDGRVAQINLTIGSDARSACRFHVTGEWGAAVAYVPRSLRWRDEEGCHAQRPPRQTMPLLQLERFLDFLNTGRPPQPDFADACRALTWTRAALASLAEGRRVEITGT